MNNRNKTTNKLNNRNKVYSITDFSQNPLCKNKIKTKNKIICEVFKDYASKTTLHGINYIGSESSTLGEKLFWVFGCILSVLCCAYLISKSWIKWNTSPVILTFNKELTPIWEIPFPAVTVCPSVKIDQTLYNYTKFFIKKDNLKKQEFKKFWDISLTCDFELMDEIYDKSRVMNFTDEKVVDNIKSVNAHIVLSNIKWLNYKFENSFESVSDFFSQQITEEGICYTFNSFNQNDMYTDEVSKTVEYIDHDTENVGWTVENGYPKTASFDDYPRRTTEDGFVSGLSFWLATDITSKDYICDFAFSGFKIILHNPSEPARPGQEYILVSANEEHSIIIKPEMTTTESALISLEPHKRKCFFSHEKFLRYFKVYTLNNCRIECLANVTLNSCGCVPFYMPRKNKTKICGFGKLDCVTNIQTKIIKYKIQNEIPTNLNEKSEAEIYSKCDCLPSCASLSFSAEISQTKLHSMAKIRAMDIFAKDLENFNKSFYDEIQIAQVDIFFKEAQFLALHRDELYGSTDFFANIGGLLGLFMGFSVLSLLEIIYFLSIHLWCRFRQVNNY